MSAGLKSKPRRMGELLERLGHVPADRVRLDPSPGAATLADVEAIRANEGVLCELIDGVLVEKPMGFRESMVGATVNGELRNHVSPRKLGFVSGSDGGMQLALGIMRMPDIGFLSEIRWRATGDLSAAYPVLGPDLAIEILSKSNTVGEMKIKRIEYFAAGTKLVWKIDPQKRIATTYTGPNNEGTVLCESDWLEGGDVVPGFRMQVKAAFTDLDAFEDRSPKSNGG